MPDWTNEDLDQHAVWLDSQMLAEVGYSPPDLDLVEH